MKHTLMLLTALFFTPLSALHAADAPSQKPNIICILADDLGIGNVGCYGSDHYRTPNVDALAAGGTRFTKFFTGSLCGPSRALIIVGQTVAELEALRLRDNTLIFFMADNGTGKGQNPRSTIGGRNLSGMKGTMLEVGGLVPAIANWPGRVPPGKVSAELRDSTDLLPTFAELTGGRLPEASVFDGRSLAPQLRGEEGTKREWIYNQLAAMWYVREAGWKLNEKGELYDIRGAPFTETLVAASADTEASKAARARLTAVLARLDPAGGIPDSGDGTGRHASKAEKKKGEEPAKPAAEQSNGGLGLPEVHRPDLREGFRIARPGAHASADRGAASIGSEMRSVHHSTTPSLPS